MDELYFVYSKAIRTGKVSHGTKAFPRKEAQQYADELNAEKDNKGLLVFWIEPATDTASAEDAPATI